MTKPEFTEEYEAHQIFKRTKRSRVLTAYFALKDQDIPSVMDADDAVLYLIPLEYFESYFATSVPHDSLISKLAGLEF